MLLAPVELSVSAAPCTAFLTLCLTRISSSGSPFPSVPLLVSLLPIVVAPEFLVLSLTSQPVNITQIQQNEVQSLTEPLLCWILMLLFECIITAKMIFFFKKYTHTSGNKSLKTVSNLGTFLEIHVRKTLAWAFYCHVTFGIT